MRVGKTCKKGSQCCRVRITTEPCERVPRGGAPGPRIAAPSKSATVGLTDCDPFRAGE